MISYSESLESEYIYIDTRTPKEFEEDHIPKSYNLPIFSNEERVAIGTLYKKDKDAAFDLGYESFNNKIIAVTKEIEGFDKSKKIIIYCWRGGMRSKAMTDMIKMLGYNALQLKGGYKSYREWVRNRFDSIDMPKFIVLHGLTGSGKTALLKELSNSLDLEGLAQHRSSVYGAVGLNPKTQKMFESLLLEKLRKLPSPIFVEGESKRIGKIHIPEKVFSAMKKGINVRMNVDIETRAKTIVKDYSQYNEDEMLKKITRSLKESLSKNIVDELCQKIDEKDYFYVAKILLEKYYDPRYEHGLSSIKYDYVIDSDLINQLEEIKDKFIKEE